MNSPVSQEGREWFEMPQCDTMKVRKNINTDDDAGDFEWTSRIVEIRGLNDFELRNIIVRGLRSRRRL